MSRSKDLQTRIDNHERLKKAGVPSPEAVLGLKPLQALSYADNNQMVMFRNSLFMDKSVTSTFQVGEKDLGLSTWGLFDSGYM